MPMPVSPTRSRLCPRPAPSSSRALRIRESSADRPTKGVSGARSPSREPSSRQTSTCSSRPLTPIEPTLSSRKRWPSLRAVASPTAIVPGSVVDWSRAATLVASPSATWLGSAAPTSPTAVWPLLMPTRTSKSSIFQAARMSAPYSSTTARIRSAASAARSGSSSWASGTPKSAQIPSPMYAWTWPPYSSTARLMRVTHSPTSAFTSAGESRSPSDVEPTTSAKSAVTGRSSSVAPTAWKAWAEGVSAAPHSGQKRATGGDSTPQAGQYAIRAIVHGNTASVE